MIPNLTIIIAGYVIVRCLDMIQRHSKESSGLGISVCILAGILILVTLVCAGDTITTGTRITGLP
jgi:hypothetical protein